jgi:hypothetical protein
MQAPSSIELNQIRAFFLQAVPREMLAAFLRATLQCYRDASSYCYEKYPREQAKDLSGYMRRAEIEKELIGIAERFKQYASAKTLHFDHYTGYYVEVTTGQVKLTQSSVTNRSELPRQATFRETLAGRSQYLLFGDSADSAKRIPEFLYALLLHGVAEKPNSKRERCGFACIRFPDNECKRYVGDTIDLFKMFPEIVAEFYDDVEETNEEFNLPIRHPEKVEEA